MFAKLVKTNEPLLVLKHEEETNFWISQLTNKKHPSLMYGFNEITEMGATIESAAKDENMDQIKSNFDKLETFLKTKL